MSFCARPRCGDLADELLQVLPPDGKVLIPLCEKHATEWKRNARYPTNDSNRDGATCTDTPSATLETEANPFSIAARPPRGGRFAF